MNKQLVVKTELVVEKRGRPTKYKPEYCEEIIYFFDRPLTKKGKKSIIFKGVPIEIETDVPNDFPFTVDFAKSIGVTEDTVLNWTKIHPEFAEAYRQAKCFMGKHLAYHGLIGTYNPGFASLVAKNWLGWKDKIEVDEKPRTSHSQLLDSLEGKDNNA